MLASFLPALFLTLPAIAAPPGKATWLTPDFVIVQEAAKASTSFALTADDSDCKARIPSLLCIRASGGSESGCEPGGEAYAKPFEQAYLALPTHLQKMFCHLRWILLENEFEASAYAGLARDDSGRITGGIVGIRKQIVDEAPSLAAWASWKEQLTFGGDPTKIDFRAEGLPMASTSLKDGFADTLYFVLAHEFAHVFDMTNSLTDNAAGGWTDLSWSTFSRPLENQDFPLRSAICFYDCEGSVIAANRQDELYQGLESTNFLTIYTTKNVMEDFADTFAFYTLLDQQRGSYVVRTASGHTYDPVARLGSDSRMASKRIFIRNFLGKSYKYPGQE